MLSTLPSYGSLTRIIVPNIMRSGSVRMFMRVCVCVCVCECPCGQYANIMSFQVIHEETNTIQKLSACVSKVKKWIRDNFENGSAGFGTAVDTYTMFMFFNRYRCAMKSRKIIEIILTFQNDVCILSS